MGVNGTKREIERKIKEEWETDPCGWRIKREVSRKMRWKWVLGEVECVNIDLIILLVSLNIIIMWF